MFFVERMNEQSPLLNDGGGNTTSLAWRLNQWSRLGQRMVMSVVIGGAFVCMIMMIYQQQPLLPNHIDVPVITATTSSSMIPDPELLVDASSTAAQIPEQIPGVGPLHGGQQQRASGSQGIQRWHTVKDTDDKLKRQSDIQWTTTDFQSDVVLTLDPSRTYQSIWGFGGAITEAATITMSQLKPELVNISLIPNSQLPPFYRLTLVYLSPLHR
jgi:hypothetical protein